MRVKYHRSYCRKYFKKTGMSTSKRNKKKKRKRKLLNLITQRLSGTFEKEVRGNR